MTPDAKKLTLAERIGGVFLGAIALLLLLLLALPLLLGGQAGVYVHLILTLIFGWIEFCSRTLPAIDWNWPMIALSVFCLAGIGFGLDRFLKWVSSFVAEKRGKSFVWPTRWTWSALVAVSIFFAVGMSVGGVLHQVGWMAGSEEPMVVVRSGTSKIAEMKQIDGAFQQALLEAKEDYEHARKLMWDPEVRYLRDPESFRKKYRVFAVVGTDGKVTGNFIFPISQQEFQQAGGLAYIEGETDGGFLPMEKVKSLLQTHRDKLKQF